MKLRLNCIPLEDRTVPATLRVNSLLDNVIPGDGQVTLREAFIAANTDATTDLGDKGVGADTIIFVGPAVGGSIGLTQAAVAGVSGLPLITSAITLQGSGETITRQSGSGDFRLLSVASTGTLNLKSLTITNPTPDAVTSVNTGGITVAAGGTLNVNESKFLGNITNANVTGNGGAILNFGNLSITKSYFDQNVGANGGAIYTDGQASVSSSLFSGNNSGGYGGAVYNAGQLNMSNTTLSGNTGLEGGGLYTTDGTTLVNLTVANNTATNVGGGIVAFGEIEFAGGRPFYVPARVVIQNSIVSGNSKSGTPNDVSGGFDPVSNHNLLGDSSSAGGLTNGSGGNLVGVDPLLLPLAKNGGFALTHALAQNSPARGAGDFMSFGSNNPIPLFDQRGTPRDLRSVDIGAYEAEHPLGVSSGPTSFSDLYAPKPSTNANEAFIKGLYQATLGRAPEAAGLSGWLTAMANGANRGTVANGFVNSIENRTKQVTRFYIDFLGRAPDQAGLTFYVDALRRGVAESVVFNKFTNSPEFISQNDNASFVNKLYFGLLGRKAEQIALDSWVYQLNNGTSREYVTNSLLNSLESVFRVSGSYYACYLQRIPSSAELDSTYFVLGSSTFGGLAISFLASQEFYNNAAANVSCGS